MHPNYFHMNKHPTMNYVSECVTQLHVTFFLRLQARVLHENSVFQLSHVTIRTLLQTKWRESEET
jgi:hypothetical protein